jgi:hypothetical protein
MDCLIPERVLGLCGGKKRTPLSTDVFVSIPKRVLVSLNQASWEPPHVQRYHV